jgi:hypothetical protein
LCSYAFRDFASTAPSCGAERGRCDARAKRRGYRQETPKSVGRDLRVLSALPLGAARSAAALRGSREKERKLVREKSTAFCLLAASRGDQRIVEQSPKSTFTRRAKLRTAFCDVDCRHRENHGSGFPDVHARARRLPVEGWTRPRRATRARSPRRRGKTTPGSSPGRCTTPRPTRTRRETRRRILFVTSTSPRAAP